MPNRKLVMEEHNGSVLVGVLQDNCDPVIKTEQGAIEAVLPTVPDFLKEAQEKWAVSPKNPAYKAPVVAKAKATPTATAEPAKKAGDLPLLSGTEKPVEKAEVTEAAPEAKVEAAQAEAVAEEKPAEAVAEVTEPPAAPAAVEPEPEVPPVEPEAENWRGFYDRVSSFMESVAKSASDDELTVLVTHGGTVSNIIAWHLEIPVDIIPCRNPFSGSVASITMLAKTSLDEPYIERLNDRAHLVEEGLEGLTFWLDD